MKPKMMTIRRISGDGNKEQEIKVRHWQKGERVCLSQQSASSDPGRRGAGGVQLGERGTVIWQTNAGLVAIYWDESRDGRHDYDDILDNVPKLKETGHGWWVTSEQLSEVDMGEQEFGVVGMVFNEEG